MYTYLEEYIYDLFKLLEVEEPKDLTIDNISNKLGITVVYDKKAFRFSDEITLEPSTEWHEWIQFAHEVCHYLRHYGNQLNMHPLFIDLQEYQANYFAYHFCIPTFMLDSLKGVNVDVITELFNVDFDFALRRLEMYKNGRMELIWRKGKVMHGHAGMAAGNWR
ncbi:ImmA/IrrE family metallo-endopeptidase [Oceanobacillus sp. FSL H7-0719]|uniref:ImmA/IrrE family metallo-endopeptidase n=1 Tax=Oceanobacillus sp. FSL H7-0719 TaxID=2954507 RepID=UPI0032508D61